MSVYDHCPQCRARLQRAAHKDIYRPASRIRARDASCRLASLLSRFFFKHPLRASRAVSQRPYSGHCRPRFQNNFQAIEKK